jgi:enamine deaminase RidA (YjgF/YER057c/UK114 family)
MTDTPEGRLVDLGLELPVGSAPVGTYLKAARWGDLLFVSGHGPVRADGTRISGKVGADIDAAAAYDAARLTALGMLGTVRRELGSLDHVGRVVKVLGMVNAAPGFSAAPAVVNGCSDLLLDVFGDAGRHARTAVCVAELPFDFPVEIEMVVGVLPS